MPSNAATYESYATLLRHLEAAGVTIVEDGDPSVDADGTATAELVVGFDGGLADEIETLESDLPDGAASAEEFVALERNLSALRLQRDELARRAASRPGRYEIQSRRDVVRKVLRDYGACTAAEIEEVADAQFDVHHALGSLEDDGEVVSREHEQDRRKTVYALADAPEQSEAGDGASPEDLTERRREVFDLVDAAEDGATAKAIAEELEVTVEAVSKHLRPMVDEGLLERDRDGKQYVYAVAEDATPEQSPSGPVVDDEAVLEEFADLPRFTDWSAEDGPRDECENCGAKLPPGFARKVEREDADAVEACPHCPDMVRGADGLPREKKVVSEEQRRKAATDGGVAGDGV